MVLAAGASPDAAARRALDALCSSYWYPIYVFVRRAGHDPEESLDLTQGFFLELLEKKILGAARPDLGRFRSFLLGALKNHLAHESRKQRAEKRGGTVRFVSLDADAVERRYRLEPKEVRTPESAYERRWAATVVELARSRLRDEMQREGKLDLYERLGELVSGDRPNAPYREIAEGLGTSEAAVKMAVRRLRRRFGRLLRDEISQTVNEPGEVDAELRHLLTVLRPG